MPVISTSVKIAQGRPRPAIRARAGSQGQTAGHLVPYREIKQTHDVRFPGNGQQGNFKKDMEAILRRNAPMKREVRFALTVYSIISSALASNVVGIVIPKFLAVFKLMINVVFVDSCTGVSAGFSPFRMRPA